MVSSSMDVDDYFDQMEKAIEKREQAEERDRRGRFLEGSGVSGDG